MADSVFTRIIRGEIPAEKIYEDENTIAFLTIQPIQPGHTLVVHKKQIDHIWDLPDEDYHVLMTTVKKVANHMREKLPEYKRIGVKVEGVEVPHAHVHLIPFNTIAEFNEFPKGSTPQELAEMGQKLRFTDQG